MSAKNTRVLAWVCENMFSAGSGNVEAILLFIGPALQDMWHHREGEFTVSFLITVHPSPRLWSASSLLLGQLRDVLKLAVAKHNLTIYLADDTKLTKHVLVYTVPARYSSSLAQLPPPTDPGTFPTWTNPLYNSTFSSRRVVLWQPLEHCSVSEFQPTTIVSTKNRRESVKLTCCSISLTLNS